MVEIPMVVDKPQDPVELKKAPTENTLVKTGQVWKDKDLRRERTVTLSKVDDVYAYYMGGRGGTQETRITHKRLLERFKLLKN
jgi:hypothetical protein